jgi:filamentous hemagglutinin family protein
MGNAGIKWQWLLAGGLLFSGIGLFRGIGMRAAVAQPVPDDTLGSERSQVRGLNSTIDLIEGGATRGNNLFHSFQEFNIDAGRAAYFIHQLGIDNIFSRVTGGTRSEINGILGVRGVENGGFVNSSANLFLINPNGIVFGSDASLDVGGSFVATTANGIQFGEQGFFSATNPEAPSLLTVDPSALFFNQLSASGSITNNSVAAAGTRPDGLPASGLRVPDGESLLLVGGDIVVDGGNLNAYGGRIELGGLAAAGTIALDPSDNAFRLTFPDNVARSNVRIDNDSRVGVRGLGGGDIVVNADRFSALNGGRLVAGTEGNGDAGDIIVNANQVTLFGLGTSGFQAGLYNPQAGSVDAGTPSNAGDIIINTGSLEAGTGSIISAFTAGRGNSGNVTIRARDAVSLTGGQIFTGLGTGAIGSEGDVTIEADSISLSNGSQIDVSTFGQGNAATITLNARSVSLTGSDTALFSNVAEGVTGNGGNIAINAETVSIRDGGQLNVNTAGQGNAGNIRITAQDAVTFDGVSAEGRISFAVSRVELTGSGSGGNITIDADSIFLRNGAQLRTDTAGQGAAGTITLNARDTVALSSTTDRASLIINGVLPEGVGDGGAVVVNANTVLFNDAGRIIASTQGRGNAGDVTINAGDRVEFQGRFAGVSTTVSDSGIGNAGDVRINTGTLSLTEEAGIFVGSLGQGNGGNVVITARDAVSLDTALIGGGPLSTAVGQAGNIIIRTGSFSATNRFGLSVNSAGRGNGGNIEIIARDAVSFSGGASAQSGITQDGVGNAGDITIQADSLSITEESRLGTASFGQGNAGAIRLRIRDTITLSGRLGGLLTSLAETGVGRGGDITIRTGSLFVSNGATIITSTSGRGRAGNVDITARDRVVLRGRQGNFLSGVYSTVEPTGIGNSGNITVSARSVLARNGAQFLGTTFGRGDAGNITINATDTVTFDGRSTRFPNGSFTYSGAFSTVQGNARGNGQDIRIHTGTLSVTNGGRVSAATLARGRAGNLILNARDAVIVDGISRDGFSSGLFTSAESSSAIGRGGRIRIDTDRFRVSDGAIVNARTQNRSRGGSIEINANIFEAIEGGQVITTTSQAGRAGDITVNADRVLISGTDANYRERLREFGEDVVFNQGENSGLFANTRSNSRGNGGRITVNSTNLTLQDGAVISAQSQGTGTAGDIRLNASEQLQLTNGDITTTATRSSGGDITVNADTPSGLVILRGDSDITTNSLGNGGNITLRGSGIIAFDDSDILARSQDARGGNITLDAFFSQNPALDSEAPFDGNDRVDVNADGELAAGTITTPDTTAIQNSLTDLPDVAIDTDTLLANSCVVRSQADIGTFIITGPGGLPQRPGSIAPSIYPTSPVRSIPDETNDRSWQPGEAIVEPQGVYQLEDGRMILSRECSATER